MSNFAVYNSASIAIYIDRSGLSSAIQQAGMLRVPLCIGKSRHPIGDVALIIDPTAWYELMQVFQDETDRIQEMSVQMKVTAAVLKEILINPEAFNAQSD